MYIRNEYNIYIYIVCTYVSVCIYVYTCICKYVCVYIYIQYIYIYIYSVRTGAEVSFVSGREGVASSFAGCAVVIGLRVALLV